MIAIIPARGGSKGLPNKNIKPLKGKPLIAYTIEAALSSKLISRVIVSTDDEIIAKTALDSGAECPFLRPSELASDDSLAVDTYKFTILKLEELYGHNIREITILQPTSPLRTTKDIDNAIQIYYDKKADSVISYCAEHHPIRWHQYINDDGTFESIFEPNLANRQSEKLSYYPNGAIYILRKDLIFSERYYTDKSYAYIMERSRSVDIDTIDDFEMAEFLLNKNK